MPGRGVFLDTHEAQREAVADVVVVHVRIIEVEVQVAGLRRVACAGPVRRGPAVAVDAPVGDTGNPFAEPVRGPPRRGRQTRAGAFRYYRRERRRGGGLPNSPCTLPGPTRRERGLRQPGIRCCFQVLKNIGGLRPPAAPVSTAGVSFYRHGPRSDRSGAATAAP